jgi:hypothetical protein
MGHYVIETADCHDWISHVRATVLLSSIPKWQPSDDAEMMKPMRCGRDRVSLLGRVVEAMLVCSLAGSGSQILHAQKLQNPPRIVTSLDPVGLVAGDWNGDGHQDLVYVETGALPTLHVLLGNGKGGFTEGTMVELPTGTCTFELVTCRLIVGDFNKDGHPDILMAGTFSSGWGYAVVPGNGDGTFGTPIVSILPASSNGGLDTLVPVRAAVADFNGDGTLDIAVADYQDSSINIYLGDGTGKFTAGNNLSDFNTPYATYTADVNHDGKADLIVFDGSPEVEIWLGDGSGGFTHSQNSFSGTIEFAAECVADLNGDGNVDLVGVDGLGNIYAMTGNANGSFNAPQKIATGFESSNAYSSAYYAADLTGDGIPELIAESLEGFDTAVATGALQYGPVQKRTSGPFATQLAIADFNEDGAADIAVGVSGGIELFNSNKQGAFPDSTITHVTVPITFLFSGDFNGDGLADVAAEGTDNLIRTYLGVKGGGFSAPVQTSATISTAFNYIGNTVGDFDGDGNQDILMSGQVLYGNGDGSFTPLTIVTGTNGLVADLNRDGKSDLLSVSSLQISAGSYVNGYGLLAQLGGSKRSFTQVTTSFTPYTPGEGITTPALLAVGDVNGDGNPDAVVYDPNTLLLETWLGNGDGSFHEGSTSSVSATTWTPLGAGGQDNAIEVGSLADMDGDGHPDLVFLATEQNGTTSLAPVYVLVIEYGDGKGNFSAPEILPLSRAFTYVMAATIDASGHPGILLGNNAVISVIRNLGGRQYSSEEYYSAGTMTGLLSVDFSGTGLSGILALRSVGTSNPNPGALGFTTLQNQPFVDGNGSGLINGSLSVSPGTVNYNQGFTVTGVLQASVSGAPVPTGSLSLSALGIPLGNVTLNAGSATIAISGTTTQTLPTGELQVTAYYSGDSFYAPSSLTAVLNVLNPDYATQTVLKTSVGGSAATNLQAGSFLTFQATVSSLQPVKYGYIAFYDGSTVLGQSQISNGSATFSTNLLSIGTHSLSAQYLGFTVTGQYRGTADFQASTSAPVPVTVTSVATTLTMTVSAASITEASVLTVTAKGASGSGSPIGGVSFFDGTTSLGALTLDSSGSAAFSTVSLATGQHSISAQYAANGIYAASVSAASTVTVNAASPALAPTLTQVKAVTPGTGSAESVVSVHVIEAAEQDGNLSLLVDGRLAATAALSADGEADFSLGSLGQGTHTLYASYAGSSLAAPSASPSFLTTAYKSGPDFTLQALANVGSNAAGAPVTLTVGTIGAWSGTVTFHCASGLPKGYRCVFSPATVAGTGMTTLTIEPSEIPARAAVLLLPFFWLLARKRRRQAVVAVLLCAGFVCLSSCGTTRPGVLTSSSIVTVEATSGALVHSSQIKWQPGSN